MSKSKWRTVWSATFGLAFVMAVSAGTVFAGKMANNVMQLDTVTVMAPTGGDSNAQGKINETLSQRGNVRSQQVLIRIVNLQPNTMYGLVAYIGDATVATGVANLMTDKKGAIHVDYEQKSNGKTSRGALPLPAMLDPMCDVRELDLVDGNQTIVLRGILGNPTRGKYEVNAAMDNTGFLPAARGAVVIHAGAHNTQFQLAATGLTPRTVYSLMINGEIIRAKTSTKNGGLSLIELPLWVPDVLDIHSIALADGGGNNVVLTVSGLGVPCNTTAPTVTLTSPANLATNAPISSQLTATFSEPMDPATITNTSFVLQQAGTTVGGTVTYANGTATFAPTTGLLTNTFYTATITTGAQDLSGIALATNFVWCFTTSTSTDDTLPAVSFTIPTNTATGVASNSKLAASFSKAMYPATLTNTTFELQQGGTSVTGVVSYANGMATFAPAASLATNTLYTATITTGAQDLAGNSLVTNFVWSFTTGAVADTNPPVVLNGNPTDLATNVAINQSLNATFSKPMDPGTISTNSFTVTGPGSANVAGTVTYDAASQVATFIPATNLAPDTTYTNTISTNATDLAGNPLAAEVVWTFTTGSQADANLLAIPLGAASTFAIMATAAISGGADQINGDVGLSPGSAQGIPPSEINGTIHVNDQAVIAAQASLLAAYNEAVDRSVNAISLPGDLGGLTLAPGLYVNGSSTGISGTGANAILTLDAQGDASAVFVFKMASTLVTDSGTSIVLAGGAQAKNIFWQVGSSATLGTTSIFKGNILAFVTITVSNGSTVDGRLFAGAGGNASGAVTVQSSTVTVPAP